MFVTFLFEFTEKEATKLVEIPLEVNRSHVRSCKTSPMASSISTELKLPNICETEPEEICFEKELRQIQVEKEILLEKLKKINELIKAYNENIELLSQCKRGMDTLTAKNEKYKAMKEGK
jgi:hypothetical protein